MLRSRSGRDANAVGRALSTGAPGLGGAGGEWNFGEGMEVKRNMHVVYRWSNMYVV